MEWYYAEGTKQLGPVSNDEFQNLVRSGIIKPATLVWKPGMERWQPLRELAIPGAASADGADTVVCAECRGTFRRDDAIFLNQMWICAACKPVVIQKLREGVRDIGQRIWRDRKTLVMAHEAVLPDKCIKCNAPAAFRLKRNLYWHSPWIYLFIFCYCWPYLIIALLLRKRARIEICLCEQHRQQRSNGIGLAWLLAFCGLVSFVIAPIVDGTAGAIAFFASLLFVAAGLVVGALRGNVVNATRIDKEHIWLSGASPDFLDNFPDWTG
ncbi:MAG: DUF4339 domain-containing protein [Verrucomicrobiota bacterium]